MNKIKSVLFSAGISLALALIFSCSSSDDPRDDPGGGSQLPSSSSRRSSSSFNNEAYKDIVFNASTHFCYDGIVYVKCNGMGYNPSTHICQGTAAYPAECNGWSYNPLEYGCCNNSIFDLSIYGCCGSSIFWLSHQRCQKDVVEEECGESWYDATNTNLRCRYGYIEAKCGNDWYDTSDPNFRCQGGVLEEKDEHCGNVWLNTSNRRCNGDVIETKCGDNSWYDASNSDFRCQNGVKEGKCGNDWYNVYTQGCKNDVIKSKCGEYMYDASTQFCHTDYGVYYICGNYNPSTQYCSNGTTPKNYGSVTYKGKTYKTVVIGEQTWMAENLNYNVAGSVCYENKESSCNTYGRLYNWETAMDVCPPDWHLPSNDEWQILVDFVGGNEVAGKKLKASNGWGGGNVAENSFGFSALPGGIGFPDGSFYFDQYGSSFIDLYSMGYWWSSDDGYCAYTYKEADYMSIYNYSMCDTYLGKGSLLSVRCVKD